MKYIKLIQYIIAIYNYRTATCAYIHETDSPFFAACNSVMFHDIWYFIACLHFLEDILT